MDQFLPFIIIGLTAGSVYGLAGMGLVLTYKTSGIFNFAYGSIAALFAFAFYFLRQEHHVPWPIAFLICVVVLAPGLGIVFEFWARALASAATTIKVLGTIGLVLIVLSLGALWFPGNPRTVDAFLPSGSIEIGSTSVGWDQVIIFAFSLIATGLLYWFLRFTRLGMAMRAVVDNPDLLSRTGENPVRVRRWAWIIGTSLAAISGILLAPSLNLDALVLTLLVVQAFGAAAIGWFQNLPMTYVGGLFIGVVSALATKYTASYVWLSGLSVSLPFIILFVVLIATPRARLAERAFRPIVEVHRSWFAPTRVRIAAGVLVFALLAIVPTFAGIRLIAYSNVLVTTILLLSLGLLVKTSGQVSLCHIGFAAIGATTMAHFSSSFGVPWLLALLLAALVVVPIGAFVAIPAIRLSGIFLALATLGFGVLLEQLFYPTFLMFGTGSSGLSTPRPGGGIGFWRFGTNNGFYFVLLVFTALTVVALVLLERGRLGRLLRAMADSPVALQTHGTTVNTTRVLVFCVSAFFAGLSGALTASLFGFAVSTQFPSFSSLTLFAVVVIVVIGEPWYALIAAAFTELIPAYVQGPNTSTYLQLLFGISAATYVYAAKRPLTVPHAIRAALDRLGGRDVALTTTSSPDSADSVDRDALAHTTELVTAPPTDLRPGLDVREITVRYGGVVAARKVSLRAPLGEITGLIGPNGAGKTTTFNACSGLVRPSSGSVVLDGLEVTKFAPHRRARLGMGRTFQRVDLFDSLSVEENVQMGREAALAGANPWTQLRTKRQDRRTIDSAAEEAIALTGIAPLRSVQVGLLPTGQRRLVELAVTLAGGFEILLLDEPSSGLDVNETRNFGSILKSVVSARGTGILLVEHDMALVRQLCDRVYVLDFGSKIFEGTPDEMRVNELVRSAYLGTDYVVENLTSSSGVSG